MARSTPGRDSDQFLLRLPDGMRERLKEAAKRNGRSMNAEIVRQLERSLDSDDAAAEVLADAPAGTRGDMETAALRFFEALKLARTHGGRINLNIEVHGIDDDALHEKVGSAAFEAIRAGRPFETDEPEGSN